MVSGKPTLSYMNTTPKTRQLERNEMKKTTMTLIAASVISTLSLPALAQYTGPATGGGYTGPTSAQAATTVEQAKNLYDDAKVTLKGQIVQGLGDEKFLFRDQTGEIVIEIDHDKWMGQTVDAQDIVIIYGEVDKDWNKMKIDVDAIRKESK